MHKNCLVYLLAFVAILESLFFGVMYAGWGSYVYILIDFGVYSELCQHEITGNISVSKFNSPTTQGATKNFKNESVPYTVITDDRLQIVYKPTTCKAQQEQLHLLYTASIGIIFLLVVFWGPLVYRLGVTWPKTLSILLISSGCLMLAFVNPDIPLLIIPGLAFVGLGGVGLLIINMRVSALLRVGAGFYVAVFSGACDSSVISLRIVKVFYDKGISFKYPLVGFALLEVFLSGASLVLHRKFEKKSTTNASTYYDVKTTEDFNEDMEDRVNEQLAGGAVPKGDGTGDIKLPNQDNIPLRHSLCSSKTLTFYITLSIWIFNFLYYVGSINTRLNAAVQDKVSHFTNILAVIMLCGIITAFIPGMVFEWQQKIFKHRRHVKERQLMPSVFPLTVTVILGLILNILTFYTSETVFLVEFIIVTLFRSFLYSTSVSFNVSAYPLEHQSILFSLGLSLGGLFSMIQIPVFMWYNMSTDSQRQVRMFMTMLELVSFVHPLRVFLEAKGLSRTRCCSKKGNNPPMAKEGEPETLQLH